MSDKVKETRGRHRKFETPEQMQKAIDAYFDKCDNAVEWVATKVGPMEIPSPDPYTIEGLAVALGMSRQSLLNYSKEERFDGLFVDTIMCAKTRVLNSIVTGSIKGRFNANASNFNLKNNFGYTEKQEVGISDADSTIKIEIVDSGRNEDK